MTGLASLLCGAHSYRVAWIASRIGETLGIGTREMQSLIVGSLLHDVGKIGIPDAVLLKPGPLDEKELAEMHRHVTQGEKIVSGIRWLEATIRRYFSPTFSTSD